MQSLEALLKLIKPKTFNNMLTLIFLIACFISLLLIGYELLEKGTVEKENFANFVICVIIYLLTIFA